MTVFINGRSVVHRNSGGKLFTISVNLTGHARLPIPYPNRAYSRHARNTASGFTCNHAPICHRDSYFSKSEGDEAGYHGGILSGTVNGKAEFITYAPSYRLRSSMYLNGIPIVTAGDLMVSNQRNTAPAPLLQATLSQSQVAKNILAYDVNPSKSESIGLEFIGVTPSLNAWWLLASENSQHYYPVSLSGVAPSTRQENRIRVSAQHYSLSLTILDQTGAFIPIPLLTFSGPQSQPVVRAVEVRFLWDWDAARHSNQMRAILMQDTPIRHRIYQKRLVEASCQTTSQFLSHMAVQQPFPLLPVGWLYLYLDGYFWREIYHNEQGEYQEIDLSTYWGCDERPITACPVRNVILPSKIRGRYVRIEYAFSEKPWSWSLIQSYGDDSIAPSATPKPKKSSVSSSRIQRQSRFQTLSGERLIEITGLQSLYRRRETIPKTANALAPVILVDHSYGGLNRAVADLSFLSSLQRFVQHKVLMTYLHQRSRHPTPGYGWPFHPKIQACPSIVRQLKQLQVYMRLGFEALQSDVFYDFFTCPSSSYLDGFIWMACFLAGLRLGSGRESAHDKPGEISCQIMNNSQMCAQLFPGAHAGNTKEKAALGYFSAEKFLEGYLQANVQQQASYHRFLAILVLIVDQHLSTQTQLYWQQKIAQLLTVLQPITGITIEPVLSQLKLQNGVTEKNWPYYQVTFTAQYQPCLETTRLLDCLQLSNRLNYQALHGVGVAPDATWVGYTLWPTDAQDHLGRFCYLLWQQQCERLESFSF